MAFFNAVWVISSGLYTSLELGIASLSWTTRASGSLTSVELGLACRSHALDSSGDLSPAPFDPTLAVRIGIPPTEAILRRFGPDSSLSVGSFFRSHSSASSTRRAFFSGWSESFGIDVPERFANAWIDWSVRSVGSFDGSLWRSHFTESFKSWVFVFDDNLPRGTGSPASCAKAFTDASDMFGESHKLSSRNQSSTSSTIGFLISGFSDPFGNVFPQSCKIEITDGSFKFSELGLSLRSQSKASSSALLFIVFGK